MRKRSRIALALLLLAVIGGIVWLASRPSEPMYKGKRLSVWLKFYDAYATGSLTSPQDRDNLKLADEAVRAIGTNAIPTLLRKLGAKDSALTVRLMALAQKQHLFKVKFAPAYIRRYEGSSGLEALGARGKSAVPELIRMYEQDHSVVFRCFVASILSSIGPAAEQAVPALARALGDANLNTRVSAVVALRLIHAHPEIAVPALVKCLSDQGAGIKCRCNAAQALGAFGADAKPAVPDLLKMLADSDESVRLWANAALQEIDPEALPEAEVK
ncbi:MAG: HEAT-like repeat protein [Pedosphaera sp.]|nr:HEAT-like repeat protein [Pedosphaera sp.]